MVNNNAEDLNLLEVALTLAKMIKIHEISRKCKTLSCSHRKIKMDNRDQMRNSNQY
jgi:hypothetical protein